MSWNWRGARPAPLFDTMPSPFTLPAYCLLCEAIRSGPLRPLTMADYLRTRPESGFVILRFDIDDRPQHGLDMAYLLHGYGLRASFYWHTYPPALYCAALMREMAVLGHEIGYHHAALSRCQGDISAAACLFQMDVEMLRGAGFEIDTVAAHGAPGYDNKRLLKARPDLLETCGLLGDGYASIDFGRVQYVSDAGWAWRRYPLRADAQDFRLNHGVGALPRLADSDVRALVQTPGASLYLNTHPELWFESGVVAKGYRLRRMAGSYLLSGHRPRQMVARIKGREGL